MGKFIHVLMNLLLKGWIYGLMYGFIEGNKDLLMEGLIFIDGWIDLLTDGWIY